MTETLVFDTSQFSELTDEQQNSVNGGIGWGKVVAILGEAILIATTEKSSVEWIAEGLKWAGEKILDSMNNEDYCDDWWQDQFDCECSQCA